MCMICGNQAKSADNNNHTRNSPSHVSFYVCISQDTQIFFFGCRCRAPSVALNFFPLSVLFSLDRFSVIRIEIICTQVEQVRREKKNTTTRTIAKKKTKKKTA